MFHSQVEDSSESGKRNKKRKSKKKEKVVSTTIYSNPSSPCSPSTENNQNTDPNKPKSDDIEEGELTDSTIGSGTNHNSDSDISDSETVTSHNTTDSELREMSIPCIRAVIVESSVASLPKGFLFVVTCMGGSIGCEGNMHSILIPDSSISKVRDSIFSPSYNHTTHYLIYIYIHKVYL